MAILRDYLPLTGCTDTRIAASGTQQPAGGGENASERPAYLPLLHLSARSDQRPGGAPVARTRVRRVRDRWRIVGVEKGRVAGGTSAFGRPGAVAYVQLSQPLFAITLLTSLSDVTCLLSCHVLL